MKHIVTVIVAASALAGCGILGGKGKPKTPTVGERISVLGTQNSVEADPALAGAGVVLPGPVTNPSWAQPGGDAAKNPGHVAFGPSLGQVWAVQSGAGSRPTARLAAAPVVADGKVFTIDTQAVVRAFSTTNGGQLWQTQIRGENAAPSTLFGGGVSYDNGRVYAVNGAGEAAALDAGNGGIVWKVKPGGPLRGAPTVFNDNVYLISQDNQLFALNPADGVLRWSEAGSSETSGVFGTASPAAAQGTVVAGFSSGELTAYRYENGRILWQDALSRTGFSTAVASLSDIDADPVIADGRVYAIGQGGRMVALELVTGQRLWEINIAGISTPVAAGDWLFVVTDKAELLAVSRATGKIRWKTALARWSKPEKKQGAIHWVGPVLAGNRLILGNNAGQIVSVSPTDGAVQSTVETKQPISLGPVVADNMLYILHDNGRLTAWRG